MRRRDGSPSTGYKLAIATMGISIVFLTIMMLNIFRMKLSITEYQRQLIAARRQIQTNDRVSRAISDELRWRNSGSDRSRDGRVVATNNGDAIEVKADGESFFLNIHPELESPPTTAIAVSPDGRWLVSGDREGYIKLWDVRKRVKVFDLRRPGSAVHSPLQARVINNLAFTADGKWLLVAATDHNGGSKTSAFRAIWMADTSKEIDLAQKSSSLTK